MFVWSTDFPQRCQDYSMRKNNHFNNGGGAAGKPQKNEAGLLFHGIYKNYSKWIKDLSVRDKKYKIQKKA